MLELGCCIDTLSTVENSIFDIDHKLSTVCIVLIYVLFVVEGKTVVKSVDSNR